MTARREASKPPVIAGHRFADVFLYEQEMPRRPVAVKVLLAGALDDDLRTRFQTEANVMAQLSHHPSIVTIFHADIAGDGRPYLVMEYCSGPGLAERYRRERMTVAESLRIGVRLGSAVETAHRAGILHRDIKPANVLTTDFGWPALTDFGIAATPGAGAGAAVGMSIPWSPPELLAEHPTGDERSDVYSLAATVYSLLAGRTPFELPGGRNGAADLVGRIERGHVPAISRDDVPVGLQAVLVRAMDRDPDRRYTTAAAFARALQQVEAELGLPVTPLDLNDDDVRPAAAAYRSGTGAPTIEQPELTDGDVGDQGTRLRAVMSVDPGTVAPSAHRMPGAHDDIAEPTRLRPIMPVHPDADIATRLPAPDDRVAFVQPAAAPSTADTDQDDRTGASSRRASARRTVAVAVGVLVLGAVVVTAVLQSRTTVDRSPDATDGGLSGPTVGAVVTVVPAPTELVGTRQTDGSVVFTWTNPKPVTGDRYLWALRTATDSATPVLVDDPTVTVPANGGQVCIEVSIVRADRSASARPATGCSS